MISLRAETSENEKIAVEAECEACKASVAVLEEQLVQFRLRENEAFQGQLVCVCVFVFEYHFFSPLRVFTVFCLFILYYTIAKKMISYTAFLSNYLILINSNTCA